MTFISHFKDGTRTTYTNAYDESNEQEADAGYDDAYYSFPEADYIERF